MDIKLINMIDVGNRARAGIIKIMTMRMILIIVEIKTNTPIAENIMLNKMQLQLSLQEMRRERGIAK